MSDTPITDAAITERLHIHRQDGSAQLFLELVDAEIAKKLERERNSLQDQRDFAMGEIERLRKEAAQKDKLLAEMRAAIRWVADDNCKGWLL